MTEKMNEEYRNEIEKALGKKVVNDELLSSGNNLVYLVQLSDRQVVAKFLRTKGLHDDNEILLGESMPSEARKYLKSVLHADDSKSDIDVSYAVFEKVEGNVLLEALKSGELDDKQLRKVAEDIQGFLEGAFSIDTERFGYLKGSLVGSHDTWMGFMFDYQIPTTRTFMAHPQTRKYVGLPFKMIGDSYEIFDSSEQVVVPIDLNLTNFMITPQGNLKVVDPGSIISGNRLASYGEFTAHTYGTPLYQKMQEVAGIRGDLETTVRGLAALSNMNVLAFVVRSGAKDLTSIKPWGNPNTFFDLIDGHVENLYKS